MKRGDIVSVATKTVYGSKPRPGLVVQSDFFDALHSVTLIGLTSQDADATDLRIRIEPSESNGLHAASFAMIDAVTTVRRSDIGAAIGHIDAPDLERIERAMLIFLGFHG